jgi:Protein of unknown function (DUF3253)
MSDASGHAPSDAAIADAILALVSMRGAGKSICPSEAARAVAAEPDAWRQYLNRVRQVAARLARDGKLTILRHNKPIAPDAMRGVIRLAAVTAEHPTISLGESPASSQPDVEDSR